MLRVPQSYIDSLLESDWALHDVTTEGMGLQGECLVTAWPKQTGIVAGVDIAERIFQTVGLKTEKLHADGANVLMNTPVLRAQGTPEQLHASYKIAQCVMEYATGIARRTHHMVSIAKSRSDRIQVAGTRKHFPGGKIISIVGLRAGGGIIHRAGLSDSILVFDQHRVLSDDPVQAVRRLMMMEPERKVCVEVDTPEDGMFWADQGVHVIQCERFSPEVLAAFVRKLKAVHPAVIINAAGGVNGENVAEYADAGCDVLVTSWPYFGKPADIKMQFSPAA